MRPRIRLLTLIVTGLVVLAFLFRACSRETGDTGPEAREPLPIDLQQKESPMLEALVREGRLPPLEERLPRNPAVVVPVEQPGRYGGTWRRYAFGAEPTGMNRIIYDPALRWSPDGLTIEPGLCWKWEMSPDARVFTFWLREGLHWSDGEPMTTADVQFWWEHFILNTNLNPVVPWWITVDGHVPELEVLGPSKFRFTFPVAHALFLERVAREGEMWGPAHYMKRFHPAYVDEQQLLQEAKAEGFTTWAQRFLDRWYWYSNKDVPMLTAWVPQNDWREAHRIFVRNPYYWKVDTEGRQLPYIDEVTFDAVQNAGTLKFGLIGGNILAQTRHFAFGDLPLLERQIDEGDRIVHMWTPTNHRGMTYEINQTYTGDDIFIRDLLREKKFRWAFSHAINRTEFSKLFFFGFGTPRQPAPIERSPYYPVAKKYATAGLEYDPDKANRLLDELGLTERDQEGYRLRPDNGKPIAVTIDHSPFGGGQMGEYVANRVLKPIGIKGIVRPRSGTRGPAGLGQIVERGVVEGGLQVLINPRVFIPYTRLSEWATQYGMWYETDGERGWEPPAEIMRLLEIYDLVKKEPDRAERIRLMGEVFDLHAEHLWLIGTLGGIPDPMLLTPRAGNVPADGISDYSLGSPGNSNPQQFYCRW